MPTIENPHHPVPEQVATGLAKYRENQLAALAEKQRIAMLGESTADERQQLIQIGHAVGETWGITVERQRALLDIGTRKYERVAEAMRQIQRFNPRDWGLHLSDIDQTPPEPPQPPDPYFWWARTDSSVPADINADFRPDGWHFWGGPHINDSGSRWESCGVVAAFELQPDRIPPSPSGRWTSTPTVELFGGFLAFTGSSNILGIGGDLWARCFMHRRQTIFQFGFGADGSVPIIVAENNEHENLIDEENAERTYHISLPGLQLMPPVIVVDSHFNHAQSLWAHLEVRFDFYVKGAGSTVWTDPEVLLRTPQWPLTPL